MNSNIERKIYPEVMAGGFSRVDVRMEYLVRFNALLTSNMTVLDFGAGRGKWHDDPIPLRLLLGDFRGRCTKVVASDVDPIVLQNPQADERVVLKPNGPLPFPDATFDMISAFSVLEHVEDAETTAAEFRRVLKPGGWLCGWTPNKWGYVGVGARVIPRNLHEWVLRIVEPNRTPGDSFVPLYRMNTQHTLRRLFPEDDYLHCTYTCDGQPFYHAELPPLVRLWQFVFWLTPPPLKGFYMIFIQKRRK